MYWKKIVYFDYLEYGEKVKNVGHVKLLLHHDVLSLDVHLKGLYETDSLLTDLTGMAGRKEVRLGRLCIDKGNCSYSGQYPADNLDGNGLKTEELTGLCIRVSESRYALAMWNQTQECRSEQRDNIAYAAAEKEMPELEKREDTGEAGENKEKMAQTPASAAEQRPSESGMETGPETGKEQKAETDQIYEEQSEMQRLNQMIEAAGLHNAVEESAAPEREAEEEALQETDKIYEDKWKQLCHNYHVIHPFGEEAYIRLTPKDFVVLRQEYQQLVNNSFLLHGYYNYRHLILGKIRDEKGSSYYLGVPGTYYEREKMVAVMFGFEGFESAAESIGPGTFGYYMRKVQI